jgi:hypothetical protein
LGFYVANLGSDRIILGHPWFKSFNPSINWSPNQLEGEDIILETAGYRAKSKPQAATIHFTPPSDQLKTQQFNITNTGGYLVKKLLNIPPHHS